MELQLGLGLPSEKTIKKANLDLNSYVYKPKGAMGSGQFNKAMLLQLGPYSWFGSGSSSAGTGNDVSGNKRSVSGNKRSVSAAFDHHGDQEIPRMEVDVPPTLPLLWNNQPNEEDDNFVSFASNNRSSDGESEGIVGWPPIKFRRKNKLCSQNSGLENKRTVENDCEDCEARPTKSMYVKVKMEGVGIGRKIDISLYHTFQTLKHTLLGMFGICQENSISYKLTYQDKEGDWLLAEDLPWRSFIGSVHQLKLMRIGCQSANFVPQFPIWGCPFI